MTIREIIASVLVRLGVKATVEELDSRERPFCFVVTCPQALTFDCTQRIRDQVKFAIGPGCPPIVVMQRGMRLEVVPGNAGSADRQDGIEEAIRHAADLTRIQLEQLESLRRAFAGDVGGIL